MRIDQEGALAADLCLALSHEGVACNVTPCRNGLVDGPTDDCPAFAASQSRDEDYVFISYASEDAEFVARLCRFLQRRSLPYWDYRRSDRKYQAPLSLEIEEAIGRASAVFAVLSEDWKKSRWAMREYFFAEDAGIPIFLLKVEPLCPTLAIAGMPYIDFTEDEAAGFGLLERGFESAMPQQRRQPTESSSIRQ